MMWRFNLAWRAAAVAREVLYLLASWLIVWCVVLLLVRGLLPDPVTQIAGPLSDQATRARYVEEFGLDRPLLSNALSRASKMLVGDWGKSWRTSMPVTEMLASPTAITLQLALFATIGSLLASLASVLLSLPSFEKSDQPKNRSSLLAALLFCAAIPSFVTALWLTYSPLPDLLNLPRYGLHAAGNKALILPAICLAIAGLGLAIPRLLATKTLITRASWYRNALALGLPPGRAVLFQGWPFWSAALGDAFAQVLVMSVTGAVAVEHVFSLPGLGTAIVDAIQLGDAPVILGIVAITIFITFGALAIRSAFALPLPSKLRTSDRVF